jgi:hypothetical protein
MNRSLNERRHRNDKGMREGSNPLPRKFRKNCCITWGVSIN